MLGISGRPYIDVEPFIEISLFSELDLEICRGIAKSEIVMGCTSSGNLADLYSLRQAVMDYPNPENSGLTDDQYRVFSAFYRPVTNNINLIYLRKSEKFKDRNVGGKNSWTSNSAFFPGLVAAVSRLPFSELGRVVIYKNFVGSMTPTHRDADDNESSNDFIWLNPRGQKKFFIFDEKNKDKHYIKSRAVWFNELDFHGTEACGNNTYSIRVDGVFNDEFRKKISVTAQ